jgi:hypothetical protein
MPIRAARFGAGPGCLNDTRDLDNEGKTHFGEIASYCGWTFGGIR